MRKKNYVVLLEHDERTGAYGVIAPDVPGFTSMGDSYEDALKMATEGLGFHLEALEDFGEDIPPPRTFEEIKAGWRYWDDWQKNTGGSQLFAEIAVTMPRNKRKNASATLVAAL